MSRRKIEEDLSQTIVDTKENSETRDPDALRKDRYNIALLMFLYILQGIPLGIGSSVPFLLQTRKVSYSEQAIFSLVSWPFSMKLLWAPVVDTLYIRRIGRRKSWLVPAQYLIAIFMMILSYYINDLMDGTNGAINIYTLTIVFFALNFLAATQDIAVDGWALTMLSRQNIGWVSTCNTVGQTAGYFMGNIVFLALESSDLCNKYLRSEPLPYGVVTFSSFLYFWSIIFFVSTSLVLLLKHEPAIINHDNNYSVAHVYKLLLQIVQLPSVKNLILILLTIKIGFAATDAITSLKLIEQGFPKEHLALMAVPMIPIDILLPICITRFTPSRRPLDLVLLSIPFRLCIGLLYACIVYWGPSTRVDNIYPSYFYAVLFIVAIFHQIAVYCLYVPLMAFFAMVSDPSIGGTYMTLLNTICNFGGNWPSTVALSLVDSLTWKGCLTSNNICSIPKTETCSTCIWLDGYYLETVFCFVFGFVWLRLFNKTVAGVQELPATSWSRVHATD